MDIKYDQLADAIYLTVHKGTVAKTLEFNERMNVDVDAAGNILGIELLEASAQDQFVKNLQKNVTSGIPIEIISGTPAAA